MANPLSFLIFGSAPEPVYFEPGIIGAFKDGEAVSLIHETEGFNFATDNFKVEISGDGLKSVIHTFKIDNFMGKNCYLTIDPSQNVPSNAITSVFMFVLTQLPANEFVLNVDFYANDILINSGKIKYISDGVHLNFKKWAAMFENADQHRAEAQKAFEDETEKENQEQERQRQAANYFNISLKSENTAQTLFVVQTHKGNLISTIHELLPNKIKAIELWRGATYDIKVYRQNESISEAYYLATISELNEGNTLTVR